MKFEDLWEAEGRRWLPRNPTFDLFIYGIPKGQPRPRAFARGGKARVYDPGTAEAWKSDVAVAFREHHEGYGVVGAARIEFWFAMPRPKAHFRTGKSAGELKAGAPVWHTAKPDLDNLVKATMDALTHLGILRDDSIVSWESSWKRYVGPGESPGCRIRIWDLKEGGSESV